MAATKIAFKFKKAMGFSLGLGEMSFGNYTPDLRLIPASKSADYNKRPLGGPIPQTTPDYPALVCDYNWDKVFTVTLKDETPAELPDHIKNDDDQDLQREYRLRNVTTAADNYTFNNHIRKQLTHQADRGVIEILSDSFLDRPRKKRTTKAT